jgi:hypothetical protein
VETACLAGTYAQGGKSACSNCGADNKYSEDKAAKCEACDAGDFTSGGDDDGNTRTACSPCSLGHKCDGNSVQTACLAGTFALRGAFKCSNCGADNKYQGESAQSSCKTCEAGSFTAEQTKMTRTTCSSCTVGHSCDGTSVETACLAGTYAQGGKSACSNCGADNKYQGKSAQGSCLTCKAGSFTAEQTKMTRTTCSSCPAGYSCDGNSVQTACLKGTFAAGGASACSNCGADNKYQGKSAQGSCLTCEAGSFTAEQTKMTRTTCSSCSAGYSCDGNSVQTACLKGTFAAGGAFVCSNCGADNKYQGESAQSSCNTCEAGSFTSGQKDVSRTTCESCTGGFSCDGKSVKTPCLAGTFAAGGNAQCKECDAGMFQDRPEQMECKACGSGQYQNEPMQAACINCAAGKFRNGESPDKSEAIACTECLHGRYQADAGKLECGACAPGSFPHSSKVACTAHNTEEHVCHARRNCEANTENKGAPVPSTSVGTYFWPHIHKINNIDQWCDYQCAAAPDRWTKDFCPNADGSQKAGSMCTCHEQRSVTQTGEEGDNFEDKQCNEHQTCSHVSCEIVKHNCPAHQAFKSWASGLGITVPSQSHKISVHWNINGSKETFSSNCDDGQKHESIRVSHFGRKETTCKSGHFCYVKSNQCVCVQRAASRPDEDRCWYDVKTPTSEMACYRKCKASGGADARACEAGKGFVDTKPPTLKMCEATAYTVSDASWDLCEAGAMDQIDGDLTKEIKYTVVRLGENGDPEYLVRDSPFGIAQSRFHRMGRDTTVLGALINGKYLISMKVSDAAGNSVEADEEVEINL